MVTEWGGVADLFGKSIAERVRALIAIAHPDFRDGLRADARASHELWAERTPDPLPNGPRAERPPTA